MKDKIIRLLVGALFVVPGLLLAYAAWFPFRLWCFSQIPATAEWGGLAKIVVVVGIGWCGGIVLPMAIVGAGLYVIFAA